MNMISPNIYLWIYWSGAVRHQEKMVMIQKTYVSGNVISYEDGVYDESLKQHWATGSCARAISATTLGEK